jgi:hypothetical protein
MPHTVRHRRIDGGIHRQPKPQASYSTELEPQISCSQNREIHKQFQKTSSDHITISITS